MLVGYPVPEEQLAEWQVAELMVNGGEYQTMVCEMCKKCAGTGERR